MESEGPSYKEKPTLLDLREQYGLNLVQLAEQSNVEPSVVYCMLLNRPVSQQKARCVIETLSRFAGVPYGLSDVSVVFIEGTEGA